MLTSRTLTVNYKIIDEFWKPDIDLFASMINRQPEKYLLWYPESEALGIDAFSRTWSNSYFYMFPTFTCLITVEMEEVTIVRD